MKKMRDLILSDGVALRVNIRTKNVVLNYFEHVPSLTDICLVTEQQWLNCENFGRGSLEELKSELIRHDVSLAPMPMNELKDLIRYWRKRENEASKTASRLEKTVKELER